MMYYCEACRVKHDWPIGKYPEYHGGKPDEQHEEYPTPCQECGDAKSPYWSNDGWKLPKPLEPVEPVSWRSHNVTALCEVMRKDQDWKLMPILADALEDAGFHDDAVLNKLRTPEDGDDWEKQRLVATIHSEESAAAVHWLEQFIKWVDYSDESRLDYEEVIQQGYNGIEEDGGMYFGTDDGADYFRESRANVLEFYRNWSLATGEPLPGKRQLQNITFSCAC